MSLPDWLTNGIRVNVVPTESDPLPAPLSPGRYFVVRHGDRIGFSTVRFESPIVLERPGPLWVIGGNSAVLVSADAVGPSWSPGVFQ